MAVSERSKYAQVSRSCRHRKACKVLLRNQDYTQCSQNFPQWTGGKCSITVI